MPANALARAPDALVLPAVKIGAVIGELVNQQVPAEVPAAGPDDELLLAETRIAAVGLPTADALGQSTPSAFGCPSCDAVPFQMPGAPAPRFRCRVGHAWSPAGLEAEQAQLVEKALWAAGRALNEKAELVDRLFANARRHGHVRTAAVHAERAERTRSQAQDVRDVVEDGPPGGG